MMKMKCGYRKRNPAVRTLMLTVCLLSAVLCTRSVAADAQPDLPVSDAPVQYTVEPGDTLMGIARKAYGDADGWKAVFEANRETIEAAGGLSEGLVITLPVSPAAPGADKPVEPPPVGTFERADMNVQQQLEASLQKLADLREEIVMEKIPLSRRLRDLQDELLIVRREYQQASRLLDSRTLDLSNLRSEVKSRQEERTYLSNLLAEYIRNFESRLHIAEIQRYEEQLEEARLAPENSNLSELEVYQAQAGLVSASLERLHDALGGTRFAGTAVGQNNLVEQGRFVLVGPSAVFSADSGDSIGSAEQRLGSLEPAVLAFENPADTRAAAEVVETGAGDFPLDPTLGNAHKIEATKQTLWEHISKGGPVMVPILGLAAAALLVALWKWIQLSRLKKPSDERIRALLDAVAQHDRQRAAEEAQAVGGPVGEMLAAGVEHIKEPRELVEEVMYEKILSARLKNQSLLPFVAISASSAPLLGLLGTVTGIINTFKLITVFGSGDVKTLSGGISEALVTTEFGLIVAIPSLLLHAFLSRKARGVVDQMDKAAVAFMNQLGKTPYKHTADMDREE